MRAQLIDAGELRVGQDRRVQRADLVHARVVLRPVRAQPGLHRRDPLRSSPAIANGAKTSETGIVRSVSVCAGTGWNGWKPPGRNFVATTIPERYNRRRKRSVTTP